MKNVANSWQAHIGKPFGNIAGILAGNPIQMASGEIERVSGLFSDNES